MTYTAVECDGGCAALDVDACPVVELEQSIPDLFHDTLVEEVVVTLD